MRVQDIVNDNTILKVGEFSILWNVFEDKVDREIERKKTDPAYQNKKFVLTQEIHGFITSQINWLNLNNTQVAAVEQLSQELKTRANYIYRSEATEIRRIELYVENKLFPKEESRNIARKLGDLEVIRSFINEPIKENARGSMFSVWAMRNNLFHGEKRIYDLNGQERLFECANAVLREVL